MVITCEDIPDFLKEAGGHRWQEVSGKGKKARVHTSTVTVSVLMGTQKVRVKRSDDEFSVSFFSGTGKGGQHRNKHQNSVRMTHIPSGLTQTAVSRSKEANLLQARQRLEELLDARDAEFEHGALNRTRSAQVGSGQRGDKRRTYRFQDDRVVDHVSGKSARCSEIMKGNIEILW